VTIAGDAAGMHLTILLPPGTDDRAIARRGLQQSLYLSALSDLHIGRAPRPGLVLGYGNTSESQIAGAVRRLRVVMSLAE
jgi:GntR family transcriptional regulator/MocR family aminotransferase